MIHNQYPLHVWGQRVDDFGAETKEPFSLHDAFENAQVGDKITFKGPLTLANRDDWEEWPSGTFVVEEREFTPRRAIVADSIFYGVNLTLYLRCI